MQLSRQIFRFAVHCGEHQLSLHEPSSYSLNLKREFPRIPLYNDFWQWAEWGKELMESAMSL